MVQTVEKWGSVLKLLDHVFNRNCRPSVGEILNTEIFREESGRFLHDTGYINSTNDSTTCIQIQTNPF